MEVLKEAGSQALSGLVACLFTLLTGYWFFNKREKDYMARIEKMLKLYQSKNDAIIKVLDFLDIYVASTINDKSAVHDNEKIKSSDDLTIEARECLNRLIVYCDDTEIVNDFDNLILKDGEDVNSDDYVKRLTKFRQSCRKELGLNDQIDLSKNSNFYWRLETSKFMNKKPTKR